MPAKKKKTTSSYKHILSGSAVLGILALSIVLVLQKGGVLDIQSAHVLGDSDSSGKGSGNGDRNESRTDRYRDEGQHSNDGDGKSDIQETKKQESEVRTDEIRLRTKTEDNKSEIEVRSNGVKTKYKFEDGVVKVKQETQVGQEESEAEGEDDVTVATGSSGFAISHKNTHAASHFPLSVDPDTHELIVTTPAGTKRVTVLPDAAIQKAFASRLLQSLSTPTEDGSASASPVELTVKDGEVAYKITGVQEYKMFGFIPVRAENTAFISAQNGTVVSQEHSIFASLLDLISP